VRGGLHCIATVCLSVDDQGAAQMSKPWDWMISNDDTDTGIYRAQSVE
jgi:hypothetical protein